MTINVAFATVAESISNISVSGVNVKGIDNMVVDARQYLPVLCPFPDDFITAVDFERVSFGGGSAKMNLSYTLNYVYYHAPIGAGGNALQMFNSMIQKVELILEAIFANDAPSGAVDLKLMSIPRLGPIADAVGNQYHGVMLSFRVTEFAQ